MRERAKMPLRNFTLRRKQHEPRGAGGGSNEKNIGAMLQTNSELGGWAIDKSNEYNEIMQEFSLARELFPYFQGTEQFKEIRHADPQSLDTLRRDPILKLTRAALPGLAPVLRRIRAVSPLMLIGQP